MTDIQTVQSIQISNADPALHQVSFAVGAGGRISPGADRNNTLVRKQSLANKSQATLQPLEPSAYWKVNVYIKPNKRREKRRGFIAVLAAMRLLITIRCGGAQLNKIEKVSVAKLYYSVPPMNLYSKVSEVISAARLTVGTEDVKRFLLRTGYHGEGTVVTFREFELLIMQLKKEYLEGLNIPDSEVAFVALGGGDEGDDRGGDVSADELRQVCKTFRLTIDIEKFIAEHDDDGSGLLEFEEFDAMFKAAAAGDKNAASGAGGELASVASQGTMIRAISSVMAARSASRARKAGDEEDVLDTTVSGEEGEGADGTQASVPPEQNLMENIQHWTEHPPKEFSPKKRTRSPHRGGGGGESVPSTAEGSKRGHSRGGKRGRKGSKKKKDQKKEKRALWESGRETSGKEERTKLKEERPDAPTFGATSRRWTTDQPLLPIPPPKGTSSPRPIRPHPRDKEMDIAALVEKLRKDDESRASYASTSRASRAPTRQNHSRAQTARTNKDGSDAGAALPPVKPTRQAASPNSSKKPKRWYSYNPFAENLDGNADPSEDPLNEAGYNKDRQNNRLPPIKRKKKKQEVEEEEEESEDDEEEEEEEYSADEDDHGMSKRPGQTPNSDLDGDEYSDEEDDEKQEETQRSGELDNEGSKKSNRSGSAASSRKGENDTQEQKEEESEERDQRTKQEEEEEQSNQHQSDRVEEEPAASTTQKKDEVQKSVVEDSSSSLDINQVYSIESVHHPGYFLASGVEGSSTVQLIHKSMIRPDSTEERAAAWKLSEKDSSKYALSPASNEYVAVGKPWAPGANITCTSLDHDGDEQWWELKNQQEGSGHKLCFSVLQSVGGEVVVLESPQTKPDRASVAMNLVSSSDSQSNGAHQQFLFVEPIKGAAQPPAATDEAQKERDQQQQQQATNSMIPPTAPSDSDESSQAQDFSIPNSANTSEPASPVTQDGQGKRVVVATTPAREQSDADNESPDANFSLSPSGATTNEPASPQGDGDNRVIAAPRAAKQREEDSDADFHLSEPSSPAAPEKRVEASSSPSATKEEETKEKKEDEEPGWL